ncbi:hypothetical protein GWI33_000606 [Rhynchophorus ferrugineus]|uniref:Uncharacterized protein n=1 Tax=Rhynchophorus ferrugineus TaxID=354439 RepID=A0A834HL29_RHYFE|nr:hypothetical protein GWI33_000606 [Rhynchophorus ferrugineus]
MSRRPVMKTSTTKSSRTLTGGTKITTTTNATEVQPYGGASTAPISPSLSAFTDGCYRLHDAWQKHVGERTTTARRPSATSLARQRAPAPLKAPAPGQYTLPAPYGPQSRQGRGQAYSSPIGLRAQMESKTPKALRYETVKGGVRAKGRPQLQGTRMQDTFSGGFNVYGAPKTTREMVPEQSLLNEKVLIIQGVSKEIYIYSPPFLITFLSALNVDLMIGLNVCKSASYHKNNKRLRSNGKKIVDVPIAVDLSREITRIFDMRSNRNERISEYMCKTIRKTKMRALKRDSDSDAIVNCLGPISSKDFRMFSDSCPMSEMSRHHEKTIRKKIQAGALEKLYASLIDDIMKEARTEFRMVTHYAGVNLKIKDKYPESGFSVKGYKHLGRTENYQNFLYTRHQMEMNWILHYKVLKEILVECVMTLPSRLFTVHIDKVTTLDKIQHMFKEKILYTSILLDDFHKKVCSTLDKHCHPLNKRYSKILQACTGLFSVYISNSITETILSIVSFTRSTKNPPYLRLFVDFEEGLILTPSPEQVVDLFSKLIDDLVMTGRELNALERKRIKGFESRTIRLCLTEEFIENCKRDIAENINNLYEPVSEYLNQMSGEFVNIYSDIISEDFLHNLFDIKFEEGCSRIQYYKKYLDKVTFVPDNEYFSIGQLVLKNYRDKLHDNLQVIIDSIFQNLSHQHLWEIHDICDSFTLIKMRANQKPLTTEELIEIGKFMFWVRNEKLDELVHRVHSSLASLCNIITLGILSDDHMELNARAINWLDEISPIVEQHSINYDQLKFEAEEKLQKVIEEINVHIKDVYPLLVVLDEMDDIKSVRKYLADIALHMTKIKEIQHKIEWINKEEVCLSFPKSSYAEFDNLRDYVYPFYHLLKLCQYVQKHESVWLDGQFELLDYKSTNERVEKFCQELSDLQKQYRKKLRQAQDENLPIKFRGTVDDPDLLNWPAPLKLSATALKILEDFKPSLKVMEIMCNRSLRSRHWKAMSEIAGFNIAPNAGTTLRKMLQVDLTDKLHEYEIISVGATKEQQLLEKLNELKLQWEQVLFDISVENDEVTILVNLDDVQTILDDHMIKVLNMRSSVFVKAHEQDVLTFYHLLQDIDCVINNWIAVQEDLLKLLPIFSVLDPVNIIPNGKKLFDDCHSIFQAYIAKIKEDSVIINIVTKTDIVADMKNCLIIMDKVKNEIRNYLKVIQIYFPRLFLLSDEELVDIIARIDEFYKIKFLTKIFPGIEDLFVSNEEVRAVVSSTGEKLVLRNGIRLDPEEGLHVLLRNLQEEVRRSLLHHTAECCKVYKKTSIRELVKKYPQQSIQLAALVFWTDQVENALKLPHNIKLLLYKRRLEMYIDEKVGIINSGNINNLERVVYKNLLLTDLNCKYLLQNFLKNGLVIDDNHFRWKVQLRYYFQNNFCTVSILDKSIDYGYEYYGNYDQIVLTPSVEKYYRTILNAFFSNIMGLVTGESGTGKTKTTTSLMEALGLFYVRFCCSNMLGMDILSKLLKGVVLCGAWFILESFDNLREEIFSVFSQELLSILEAKKQSDKAILLDGTTLRFDPRCFVCVITNTSPSKIFPENLKALFRTYTLSTPDFRALMETLLLSKGTLLSRSLSRTLVRCLELLKDEISFQNQYSFGLRTLSTILNYFEQERLQNPHQSDDKILYRSIRKVFDMTLSPEDASIFNDTLKNIYNQESDVCQSFDANLEQAWKDSCSSQQIDDVLMTKGLEIVEALTNKSSIILIGGISVGKSSCLDVCIQTLETIQNKAMVRNCINPDCLSYPDLYGEVSRSRNFGWIDGVLLRILRKQSELPTLIVFDGQIDPGWAETLSGILEGKKIFLESGEVLLIRNSINLVFETDNLKHCSPSMISHCGVVYIPSNIVNYQSLIKCWLKSCTSDWYQDHQTQIESLMSWFIPPCLETIRVLLQRTKWCIDENTLIRNTLTYFQLILDDATSKMNKKEEDPKNMITWIHATFLLAGALGFSGFLDEELQQHFDEFYKMLWRGQNPEVPYPNGMERLEVGVPHDGILLDYCYLYKQRGTWKMWSDLLKNEKIVENQYLSGVLVPTPDTLRCGFLMDIHVKYNKRFMIAGPTCTGKSAILRECSIVRLDEETFEKSIITFNSLTTSNNLQNLIINKLNKRTNGRYTPSGNKRFVFLLEDLHCAHRSSTELLRQHFDYNSWIHVKTLDKILISSVNFIGSFNTSYGGDICRRFLRHFNLISINPLQGDTIQKIYSQSLFNTWKKGGFPSDISVVISQMVNATWTVFESIRNRLKPSPSQAHYVFDLFSFSNVMNGCSFLKKETYDANKKVYVKLWMHEMMRVFGDRLEKADFQWLMSEMEGAVRENFPDDLEEVFSGFGCSPMLFFGTFHERDVELSLRRYEEVNFSQLADACLQELAEFNTKHRFKLYLIFFQYALEKLVRIGRILSLSKDNVLFLGQAGYGRRSLTKLAAFMFNHDMHQPILNRNYDLHQWHRDFKTVYKNCAGSDRKGVLYLTEELIIDDTFLELVDYVLRDGDIMELFNLEEQHEILELARLSAQGGNKNIDISSYRVFLYFKKCCAENVRLFLSFNVNGDGLRRRISKYRSLVSKTTVIMWKDWPDEALRTVANTWTQNVNLPDDTKSRTIEAAIYFHRTSQEVPLLYGFTTPKAFVHMIGLFSELIMTKQKKLVEKKDRFLQGLSKLSYASDQILSMQKALAEFQPELEKMTKNARDMTEEIALETIGVEKASALVRKDEKIASEQAAIAQVLKSECESELAQAIPILEDAISALNTLKPSDITLVKSMKNPPDAIKLVMASVCVIKDVKPDRIPDPSTGRKTLDYWGPSKRILGDMNFLQTLKDFDKDHIKPEIMVKIRKEYLPHKDFKPHVVAKASSAAEGLCKWIIAMDMYDKVAKEVAPKKEKLHKAERDYAETMRVLNEKKEEVVRIEEKLAALNVLLSEATKKQTMLQVEVDLCSKKLGSAQKLIGGLGEERLRWTKTSEDLQKHYELLAGDIMLSSAIVAYLASLDNISRQTMIQTWRRYIKDHDIPHTTSFDLSMVLSNDVEVESWKEYGLPPDNFFTENAIIYNHSKRFCIFLDPQAQSTNWILRTEAGNNIIVTKFTYKNWMEELTRSVQEGSPILIKDTKGLVPPCLNYLLFGQTFIQQDDVYTVLDNREIKIHQNFRLYVVCTTPDPPYSLELRSRLNMINFSLTTEALEESLLRIVVEIEKPDIKKLSKELVWKRRETKAELKDLEVKILNTLCESKTDILEDDASISILDSFKDLARQAKEKQKETMKIDDTIREFKKGYVNVARYVADLFFCISDLKKLNCIYQFSLGWFRNLYFTSILNAEKSKVLEIRCRKLCDSLTYDLFKSITKGLFEKDKLLFTFWLATRVSIIRGQVTSEELEVFLRNSEARNGKDLSDKPRWIPEGAWTRIKGLENIDTFAGLTQSIQHNKDWKLYLDNVINDIPSPWNTLSEFNKLIILRILKPHKTYFGIISFIDSALGSIFLKPVFFQMQEVYNESYNLSPVLFVLTPSVDVLKILHNFATIKRVLHKFKYLSLGRENLHAAETLIRDGQVQGYWVLLQNCHYVQDWLNDLEQRLERFDFENTHENFRLFLTCDPVTDIPLDLIQNAIKVVEEPPNTLKKNLLKTYTRDPIILDDFYYGCPGKQDAFSKLLYSFCHFHFVLQERYKIRNWCVPYRFSESDLLISLDQLRNLVNTGECLFEKVYYLIGECSYNGYLENAWEKMFVQAVLIDCLNERSLVKGKFAFNNVGMYRIPSKNDRSDYVSQITALPWQDDPEVLYITQYEFVRHKGNVMNIFLESGLRLIQNKKTLLNKENDNIIALLEDILQNIPEKLSFLKAPQYINREISLYNKILERITDSLTCLTSSLKGDTQFTEDFEALLNELIRNKVPTAWLAWYYPTLLGLSGFLKNLNEKVSYFRNMTTGEDVRVYWLGAFFYPRSLLASVILDFSKDHAEVPIDDISFNYGIINDDNQKDHDPYSKIIDRLFILGASYDVVQNTISELRPHTYYDRLGPVLVKAVTTSSKTAQKGMLRCCIFRTEPTHNTNTFRPGCYNYISEIALPSKGEISSWISNDTAEHILAIGSEDVEAVEDEVTQELFSKSMLDQHEKVYCRGHHISEIKQQMITTPAGLEPVIQQAYTERKLERDMGGEKLVKNLSVVEMDECSGKGIKVIISEQQLDPDFGLSSEGTDTVTVRETISVTPSYTSTARDVTHEVTKPKLEIDPAEVARLVQEENEDVENTLKIAPPDLVLTEEKYGIKKRLQQLRLNSESMALIEEAVISPTVNADEALGETTPEAIVQIMHTVESGVAPECAPDQVFHTLFEDKPTEQSVVLSSIGPGPLQDVVVPQQLILDLQKEPLSTDLNKLTDIYKNVTDAEDWPHVDVFASVMEEEQKHPNKGVQSRPFKPIADEEVPWGEEDLEPLVNIVGAEPVSVLDPFNVSELQESGNFEKELTHGIEYFIDADPVQYMSRVQLRGSHPPPWFPGYIYALPDFPDIVKVARNPDEVFLGSWKACQPKILPEESITIMP